LSREKRELVEQLLYLSRANEAANEAFDDVACEKLGINRTDLRCLNIVDNQGPITAGRLADLSGLTTAAVTAVLDRLERAGYARRVRDQPDRRQVIVELTPRLAECGAAIWGLLGAEAMARLERMSVEELNGVIEFFRFGIDLNQRHVERIRGLDLG
jgi:DNA-binding MarR family transcriptional regulator